MADTPAFNSDVVAYPAITLIEHAQGRSTMVAQHPDIDVEKLALLAKSLRAGKPSAEHGVSLVEHACSGSEPWVLGASDKRALLRRLEAQFPTLEEAGCKVGIGAPPVLTKPSSPQWMNST